MGVLGGGQKFSAPLVDKMVGDAYPRLKFIYDNMQEILTVAAALQLSTAGAPLLVQRCYSETGGTGDPGEELLIPFTDLDIDYTKILASHACVIGNNSGDRYYGDSGVFTAIVRDDGLWIKLSETAPIETTFAVVEWFFIYGG